MIEVIFWGVLVSMPAHFQSSGVVGWADRDIRSEELVKLLDELWSELR